MANIRSLQPGLSPLPRTGEVSAPKAGQNRPEAPVAERPSLSPAAVDLFEAVARRPVAPQTQAPQAELLRASGKPRVIQVDVTPKQFIPDNSTIVSSLHVREDLPIDALRVKLDIRHPYRGDLVVTLESPEGTRHVISNREGQSADDIRGYFDVSSAFQGELSQGEWKLHVEDGSKRDQGTLVFWRLEVTSGGDRPTEPGPTEPGPTEPGPTEPGPTEPGPTEPGPTEPGPTEPGPTEPGPTEPGPTEPGPTEPGPTQPVPGDRDPRFEGKRDEELKRTIGEVSKKKQNLSYDAARKAMFGDIDNFGGYVTCVYTGRELQTNKVPNASNMNTEHTWPQSKGATGAAKSDLHHLFVTDSKANSRRGSYPFGEVVGQVEWSDPSGAKLGRDANGNRVFEPPDSHKGNVARALFYFSAVYNKRISSAEEEAMKAWNVLDPVDAAEVARNDAIERYQRNRNPFIDDPTLANDISDF
jgi:deoxyribonuclease-1